MLWHIWLFFVNKIENSIGYKLSFIKNSPIWSTLSSITSGSKKIISFK